MRMIANSQHGMNLSEGARGYVFNGDMVLVIQALDTLPLWQYLALYYCFIRGMSYPEAAKRMGLSRTTVRWHKERGVKSLRVLFAVSDSKAKLFSR